MNDVMIFDTLRSIEVRNLPFPTLILHGEEERVWVVAVFLWGFSHLCGHKMVWSRRGEISTQHVILLLMVQKSGYITS